MTTGTDIHDAEWVASLNDGDQRVFSAIYTMYAADLFRYAHKNISSREDCEEIVQEVFVSLWARRGTLRIENLQGYLFKSVRYAVGRYFLNAKTRRKYAEHYGLFEEVYDPFHEADKAIDPDAIHAHIDKSLPALTEKCQLAFRMRLYENLSNTEIALRMNVKKATVEHYMVMALNHLRSSYKELYRGAILLLVFLGC